VKANVAIITAYMAAGHIGIDDGNDLIAAQKSILEAHVVTEMEPDLATSERIVRERLPLLDVTTSGGLGSLPGTDILMPARRARNRRRLTDQDVTKNRP
jgi:hypothetical protein